MGPSTRNTLNLANDAKAKRYLAELTIFERLQGKVVVKLDGLEFMSKGGDNLLRC